MAWRVRFSAIPFIRTYGELVLPQGMMAFSDLGRKADEVADAAFARLGSQPAGEDFDGDMSVFAEQAQEEGQAFYEIMTALRQATLNLFTAGLFHLVEQHLADLCRDGAFDVPPPGNTKLSVVSRWYGRHFGLHLEALASWGKINELRLVANAVKHAEGGSAKELRALRPELFQNPVSRRLLGGESHWAFPVHLPLAGEDLYVTDEDFRGYSQSTNQFMEAIAGFFDTHGQEGYPW